MSVLQNSYSEDLDVGYAGMVANGETSNRITRTAEAAIAFGAAVFQGTGDHDADDDPAAGDFLGIAIATAGQGLLAGETADTYQIADNVPILTGGAIFVDASLAVANRDPVYVTPAGVFTNVDGGGGNTLLTGFVYDQTIAAAGVVRIAKR